MAVIIPFRRRAASCKPASCQGPRVARCPLCSEWFDVRDLDATLDHLHGAHVMTADNDDDDNEL